MTRDADEPVPIAEGTKPELTFEQHVAHQELIGRRYAIDSQFWSPIVPLLAWVVRFAFLWLIVWPEVRPLLVALLRVLAGKDGAL